MHQNSSVPHTYIDVEQLAACNSNVEAALQEALSSFSSTLGRLRAYAATAKNRMGNAPRAPKRRVPHAPTAIGGIADGVRRSTADTLERG